MRLFEKCPLCNGELVEKEVEKILMGSGNTATISVRAEVCIHCGEKLYSKEVINRFEEIREQLKHGNIEEFIEIGKSYQVV
ncbi:MAG: YgiT-type zinc finger protein [Nitrospirae bacterium]|nr:YgiT-type zinc finger protein [Nitrospirota bacterium]